MAESPAETARIQMQSDRARGVSLHRPCPALCLPSFRGYPARLSGSAFCCIYTKAPKTPAQPLVPLGRTCSGHPRLPGRLPGAALKDVGGRNKSGQGDLGLYRARYGTADFAQPDSHGSSKRLNMIIAIIKWNFMMDRRARGRCRIPLPIPLRAPRLRDNSAVGQLGRIIRKLLISCKFSTSRGAFSRPRGVLSLLSGRRRRAERSAKGDSRARFGLSVAA